MTRERGAHNPISFLFFYTIYYIYIIYIYIYIRLRDHMMQQHNNDSDEKPFDKINSQLLYNNMIDVFNIQQMVENFISVISNLFHRLLVPNSCLQHIFFCLYCLSLAPPCVHTWGFTIENLWYIQMSWKSFSNKHAKSPIHKKCNRMNTGHEIQSDAFPE